MILAMLRWGRRTKRFRPPWTYHALDGSVHSFAPIPPRRAGFFGAIALAMCLSAYCQAEVVPGRLTVAVSTTPCSGGVAVSSVSATIILSSTTLQANVSGGNPTYCNEGSVILHVGGVNVSTHGANIGISLQQYSCYWPEGPGLFRGTMYGIAEAGGTTASYGYSCK